MNDPECLASARTHLFTALQECNPPLPRQEPLAISASLAAAVLQKSIRRGETAWAVGATATLLEVAPDRLWRRLACIAFEDVGLADLEAVVLVTAAATNKRFRQQLGGDWRVAAYLVRVLAEGAKCRATDDLLMASDRHPAYARTRLDLDRASEAELLNIVASDDDLIVRATACCTVLSGNRISAGQAGRYDPYKLFDALEASGVQADIVAVARAGFRKSRELLPAMLCLLHPRRPANAAYWDDLFPAEVLVRGIPGWTYDVFSPEGRAALCRFLTADCPTARWIAEHVPRAARLRFLGMVVFQVEGGLCRRRLRWELGDQFRQMIDRDCFAPHCRNATELLAMARADIPLLNAARAA